ncbi:MAG: SIMPL domain-containing protein [bacterium]|nr:SIMPL domain-containing protein [bacterium]
MQRITQCRLAAIALASTVAVAAALPQDVGSRRGGANPPSAAAPDREAVADFIEVQGSAEVRVAPSEARLVLGFMAEGKDAAICRAASEAAIDSVTTALSAIGVATGDMQRDFISITPLYTWEGEEISGKRALVERRTGYRLDENLHVHVRDLGTLAAVRTAALESGASDLIAFEYGTEGLDAARNTALAAALAAAKGKAGLLLGEAFGASRPTPINVRETVTVHAPADLYETYTATGTAPKNYGYLGDLPRIPAARPLTTYYRGFDQDVDVRGGRLAMRTEFSVVARIWLYYGAPGRESMVPGTRR